MKTRKPDTRCPRCRYAGCYSVKTYTGGDGARYCATCGWSSHAADERREKKAHEAELREAPDDAPGFDPMFLF